MTAFLANENISRTTVELLRRAGHDVKWVSESIPSVDDEFILLLASSEQRIIITFDSDYGELIYRRRKLPPFGVIYLRLKSDDPALPANLILKHMAITPDNFEGKFAVLSEQALRLRPL